MFKTSSHTRYVGHIAITLAVAAAFMAGSSAHASKIITFEESGLPVTSSPSTFEVGGLRFSGTMIVDLGASPYVDRALPTPVHGIAIGPVSSSWSYLVTIERVGGGAFDLQELTFANAGGTPKYLIIYGYKGGELYYANHTPPSRIAGDNTESFLTFRPNFHDADRITIATPDPSDGLWAVVDNIVYSVRRRR